MSALEEAAPPPGNGNGNSVAAPVQSVDRALTILELLARDGEAGVTEIAAELGVHKSTAFRLLVTLEAHRLVEQVNDRGPLPARCRRPAPGRRHHRAPRPGQEARPVCRQLAADTGETVNIAVLSETSALYLDQVAGLLGPAAAQLGRPAHPAARHQQRQGAAQRARPTAELKAAVRELPRFTAATITTRRRLREELAVVREAGVRRRGRRARDRADRRRGADPQRARRRHRLDERLRPDLPARRGPPGRDRPDARRRRRRGLPPSRLGPADLIGG